jgi:hypothetical protein
MSNPGSLALRAAPPARSAVLLEMSLGRAEYARFHREVLSDATLTTTLHHARVTSQGATLKVSLRGEARRIARVVGALQGGALFPLMLDA